MRTIETTETWRADARRVCKDPESARLVKDTLDILLRDCEGLCGLSRRPLPAPWQDYQECALRPDLLLIYRKMGTGRLQLVRLGSHADFESRDDEFTIGFSLDCGRNHSDTPSRFFQPTTPALKEAPVNTVHKKPSLAFALTALLSVVAVIASGIIFFNLKLHLLMLSCWVLCALFAKLLGYSYAELEVGAYELIQRAMGAVIILMCVGALIGAWISAGTVPVMIYAGLKIITPTFFLVTSLILCSVTALTTGTSWGAIGTVGLALMGIGAGLGFPPGLTAATIICGSFFGDKLSPLSDTTNMAAAVSGVPLLRHVRHMVNTVTPAYIITLVLYTVLGFTHGSGAGDATQLTSILEGINANFRLGFIPTLPMLLVLVMLMRQANPVLAIVSGALLGVVVAVTYAGMDITTAFNSMWKGYKGEFADPMLAKLLNRGGIVSMLDIAALVIFACGLGGMLRHLGIIDVVLAPVARHAKSGLSLVLATLVIGYGTLMLTAACYFSIVMNGTLMAPLFRKQGFRPENCSRVVEDAGTLGGPLVPWSSNALFPMTMLSVGYLDYAPWAFLLYLAPLCSIIYAAFNINMTRLSPQEMAEDAKNGPVRGDAVEAESGTVADERLPA